MGHYDSCYEADERRRSEGTGVRFKVRVHGMTDEAAGEYKDAIDAIVALASMMNGTAAHHERLAVLAKRLR